MTDAAALRGLVELEQPHLIVPEIEAIATDMLVEIEREGLARVIPTARAAQLTMHREGIRRLAAETLGLPTSPYAFANSLEELRAAIDDGIGYPPASLIEKYQWPELAFVKFDTSPATSTPG